MVEVLIMNNKHQETITNFKKVRSLMNKIIEMVENDEYCIDIMNQNLAAIGLLRSAHQKLMENHLNTCFKQAMESDDPQKKQEMIQEILTVINLFNK